MRTGTTLNRFPVKLAACTYLKYVQFSNTISSGSLTSVLQELILSENSIEELPPTLIDLSSLRIIKLQNNKLRIIPIELPLLPTLEAIDLSNNENLEIIPLEWRGSTKSIKILCELHKSYQDRISELIQSSSDASYHMMQMEIDQIVLEEKNAELKYQVAELGRKVLRPTRLRIESAAKVHASRGSAKKGNEAGGFPAVDESKDDDDDDVNHNSVGQRLKDICCNLS